MDKEASLEVHQAWRKLKWTFALGAGFFMYSLLIVGSTFCAPIGLSVQGFVWFSFTLLLLWVMFEWIHKRMHPVQAKPVIRVVLRQVLFSVAAGVVLFVFVYLAVKQSDSVFFGSDDPILLEHVAMTLGVGLIMSLLTLCILLGSYLIIHWKQSAVESEQFKKETAVATYNALKSQINPHFIFNSLNTLQALIHEAPQDAGAFLGQLSDILRYTLHHRNNETVPAKEELTVTEAYLRLFASRFGKFFTYHIGPRQDFDDFCVVSLTLPTLIENVFKHNVLSEEVPIRIRIRREGDYLVVENTKGARKIAVHSLGVGLSNIWERYHMLGSAPVIIEDTAGSFSVKVPLLQVVAYEDSHH